MASNGSSGRRRYTGAVQVMIPYSVLVELLNASEEVQDLRDEVQHLSLMQAALRNQFLELMERFRELQD